MNLIEFNAYKGDSKNASSKAKNDITQILTQIGYEKLYNPSELKWKRRIQQFLSLYRIKQGSIVFIQYQSHKPFLYRILASFNNVKKIAIIHDLESLRGNMSLKQEIKLLNGFDAIISHNNVMTNYLKSNGVNVPIKNIQIFDYLIGSDIHINNNFDMCSIFFAGNLKKSHFLTQLEKLNGLKFNIYGASFDEVNAIANQQNVDYKGSFSPEELISNIEGGWGLVWDGDSLDTCSGINGEYLKYNNPHKVSMCIVSERPVIIWEKAAMAAYIKSRGIGICIPNLYELYDQINAINIDEYNTMLKNVKIEKRRLIEGQNLKDCLRIANNY